MAKPLPKYFTYMLCVKQGLLIGHHIGDDMPEVIKIFSCSTQLSMNFLLLINVKMPKIVGILTFMSRKNSILGLSESDFLDIFLFMSF